MTKRELIMGISNQTGQTQQDIALVLETAFEAITEQLVAGNRLEIRNFGVFTVKTRNARQGRNPKTGDQVAVQRKQVPYFKPGKALRNAVSAESYPGVED